MAIAFASRICPLILGNLPYIFGVPWAGTWNFRYVCENMEFE
jgi:hypothetical protein